MDQKLCISKSHFFSKRAVMQCPSLAIDPKTNKKVLKNKLSLEMKRITTQETSVYFLLTDVQAWIVKFPHDEIPKG